MEVLKSPASDALGRFVNHSRLASGIEAGIIGGAAMLGLLVSGSLLRGHVWWEIPNVLGSTFYGSRAFRSGPGMATLAGAALHFTITGTVGGLFGLACGAIRNRRRLVMVGMLAGISWFYLAGAVFWRRVNPLVPLYAWQPASLLSHAVFGACLGFIGQRPKPAIESSEPGPWLPDNEPT